MMMSQIQEQTSENVELIDREDFMQQIGPAPIATRHVASIINEIYNHKNGDKKTLNNARGTINHICLVLHKIGFMGPFTDDREENPSNATLEYYFPENYGYTSHFFSTGVGISLGYLLKQGYLSFPDGESSTTSDTILRVKNLPAFSDPEVGVHIRHIVNILARLDTTTRTYLAYLFGTDGDIEKALKYDDSQIKKGDKVYKNILTAYGEIHAYLSRNCLH